MSRKRGRGEQRGGPRVRGRTILLSVCAFVLVTLLIPLAFGLSGVLNDVLAGKKLMGVSSESDLIAQTGGGGTPDEYGEVGFTHAVTATYIDNETQAVFYSDVLGEGYNEVILTANSGKTASHTTRNSYLCIQLNVSTDWAISHKLDMVRIWLNTSTAKVLLLPWIVYTEYTASSADSYPAWLSGNDVSVSHRAVGAFEPYVAGNATWSEAVTSTGHINTTSTEWRYFDLNINHVNVLKANTLFVGHPINNESLQIVLMDTGDTDGTSLIVGDDIKFRIELFSSMVSPYSVAEVVVGSMGFMLIVFGVMATPVSDPLRGGRRG